MPRWPFMLATHRSAPTGTSCTAPSVKGSPSIPDAHLWKARSGSFHRADSAKTKPLPQALVLLQTWAMIAGPSVSGAVASPIR